MELKDSFAGTLESGDILIQIAPSENDTLEIELDSTVAYQFGNQIKKVIAETLHERGIDAVVARMQLQFKTPLRSTDRFVSKLGLRKEGIKYVFVQDLYRLPDLKPVLKSTVEAVCVVNGKMAHCDELDRLVP